MPRFAPRLSDGLLAAIEAIAEERVSLAEAARRVGAAAQEAGVTRPSVVHVRRLVAELREEARVERELRQVAARALAELAVGRDPIRTVERAVQAAERVEERARRR